MYRSFRGLTLALGLVLGSAAVGQAADLCLDLGGVIYVGKQVTIPPKGGCKTWKGVAPGLCTLGTTTGTICRNTANNRVDVSLTTTCANAEGVYTDHVQLPYPSLVGGSEDFYVLDVGSGGFANTFSADKVTCVPSTVPIPLQDTAKGRFLASR
jgi:hypothetical protein